jgi:hypothetical protein
MTPCAKMTTGIVPSLRPGFPHSGAVGVQDMAITSIVLDTEPVGPHVLVLLRLLNLDMAEAPCCDLRPQKLQVQSIIRHLRRH